MHNIIIIYCAHCAYIFFIARYKIIQYEPKEKKRKQDRQILQTDFPKRIRQINRHYCKKKKKKQVYIRR